MRQVRIFALAVTAAFVLAIPVGFAGAPPISSKMTATAMVVPKEGDIFGYFFIKGTVPVAFKNIDHLNLSGEYGTTTTPPDYGRIRLNNRAKTDYLLLKPTLDGKHLTFSTKKVAGVSYEFDGMLTRTNFDDPQPESEDVVLTGTLKKMKSGKVLAQAKLSFSWFLGD